MDKLLTTYRTDMDKKKDYTSNRVSQKDISDTGRYVPDRHSRLAEQNAKLEKEAKRSHTLMLVTFVAAMLVMGLPAYKGVRSFFNADQGSSSSADSEKAVTAAASSEAESSSLTADSFVVSVSSESVKSISQDSAESVSSASSTSGTSVSSASSADEKSSDSTASSSSDSKTAASSSDTAADAAVNDGGETGPADTGDSTVMLDTTMGPMLYYSQDDPEWADYLWGGTDPISEYGCGPTTVAMIANSFSDGAEKITPVMVAEWAVENGDFAQGSGSYNALIPDGIAHFSGLNVESMNSDMSADAITNALKDGCIMVALVGPNYFTQDGHFIVICSLHADGSIGVADVKSMQRTRNSYSADFIAAQLLTSSTNSGGPLWKISK